MSIYEEIEIEDMTYDPEDYSYTYPCPCGDKFRITLEELWDGEDIAKCPSCTLRIMVIYEEEDLPELPPEESEEEKELDDLTEKVKALEVHWINFCFSCATEWISLSLLHWDDTVGKIYLLELQYSTGTTMANQGKSDPHGISAKWPLLTEVFSFLNFKVCSIYSAEIVRWTLLLAQVNNLFNLPHKHKRLASYPDVILPRHYWAVFSELECKIAPASRIRGSSLTRLKWFGVTRVLRACLLVYSFL